MLLSRIWHSLGAPLPSSKLLVSAGAESLFTLRLCFLARGEGRGAAGTVPAVSHPPPPWPSLAWGLATVYPAAPPDFLKCFLLGWTREPDVSFFSFRFPKL